MPRMLINATNKPFEHPLSGQVIFPGQSYSEPDEDDLKEQEAHRRAFEDAKVKEEAEAKKKPTASRKTAENGESDDKQGDA